MNNDKKSKENHILVVPSKTESRPSCESKTTKKYSHITPNFRYIRNITEKNKLNQKSKTNKYRSSSISRFPSTSQKKLFSLVDIKDKFYYKSTKFPNQYRREILNRMFEATDNVSKTVKNEHLKKEEPKYKKVTEKIEKNRNKEDVNKYRIQSALISRKERLYQPNYWDNYDIKEIKKKPKDSNKPEGYEFYQKNFGIFRNNYIKNNCIDSSKLHSFNGYMTMSNEKKPILFRKFNQMRQNQSDIFFKKDLGDSKVKEIKQAQICKLHNDLAKYSESDIFNLRLDNKNIIGKSGEFSYFRNLNEDKKKLQSTYSVNNETQLGWGLRSSLPSFLNYTSTQFHLLNRSIKNIGNTKEKIMNESKKISPNFNPINRKKSLCEFIDLCRVSAPNINNDYNKAINENPNVFKKRNEISSEFYNIYNNYTNLCDKPFQKFSSMKINDNNH